MNDNNIKINKKRKKRKNNNKKFFWNLVFIICLIVFAFSVFNIAKDYYGSFKASNDLKSIKQTVITTKPQTENNSTASEKNTEIERIVSVEELKKLNEDSIGWIEIPGTTLDEPIVQGKDNDFYLWNSFYKKKYPVTGALFLDVYNNPDFNDRISYIFGHNIWDKSKFYCLQYFEDSKFMDEHKEIFITLQDKKLEYEIIGINLVDPNTPLYELSSNRNNDVNKMKSDLAKYLPQSEVDQIDENTKLLMLVTCKKPNDTSLRRILFAKLKNVVNSNDNKSN